jgi:hypothetical protein
MVGGAVVHPCAGFVHPFEFPSNGGARRKQPENHCITRWISEVADTGYVLVFSCVIGKVAFIGVRDLHAHKIMANDISTKCTNNLDLIWFIFLPQPRKWAKLQLLFFDGFFMFFLSTSEFPKRAAHQKP